FDASGALAYASFMGGVVDELPAGRSLAIDASGNAYVAGTTNSSNFPTKNSLQAHLAGGTDGFVSKISPAASTAADLSVSISVSPDPGAIGGRLTYHITVSNHGPQDATGVQLTNTLPAGVTFNSSTISQGSCTGTASVVCDVGALSRGSAANVTVVATTPNAGLLADSAIVTGDQPDSEIDPPSVTIVAGTTADYTVTVGAHNGPFVSDVSMTCSITLTLPCQLGTTTVFPGPDPNSPATFPLTVFTTGNSAMLSPAGSVIRGLLVVSFFTLPGIVLG